MSEIRLNTDSEVHVTGEVEVVTLEKIAFIAVHKHMHLYANGWCFVAKNTQELLSSLFIVKKQKKT